MKILLVDNYDSFTYNLKQLFEECNCEVDVIRNDKVNLDALDDYEAFVFSPGPGLPDGAGEMKSMIKKFIQTKPMLGICLGMQGIAEVLGAELHLMDKPLHGCETMIEHFDDDLFEKIPRKFNVGRYHSWVVNTDSVNDELIVLSKDEDGLIMGIKHQRYPVYGLQFHPESVLTGVGSQLISNFLQQIKF